MPNRNPGPSSFTGAPAIGPGQQQQPRQQQAARMVEVGPTKRTYKDRPSLSVSMPNTVRLSMELLRRLDARHGTLLELRPPRRGRARGARCWMLIVGAPLCVPLSHKPGSQPFFRTSFFLRASEFSRGGQAGALTLTLELDPDAQAPAPGYFPLRVVAQGT